MGNYVILKVEDGIATITLNRPEVGNALNMALLTDLKDCLEQVQADAAIDVVIITGAGRMFCTGEDLKGLASGDSVIPQATLAIDVVDTVRLLPLPTIAAINGYAVTGGLELIIGCDLRIAAEEARFADTHSRVGLPGGGSTQLLPKLMSIARAKEMLFTGDFLTAQEAFQAGFLNRVVPLERLMDEALEMAKKIQGNDRELVRTIKRLVNDGLQADMMMERAATLNYVIKQHEEMGKRASVVRQRNKAIE